MPSLPEQQRIVAILDEAFEAIATATANAEKNLANARELFDSFVGALLGESDEWQARSLGELCHNLDGKRRPITKVAAQPGLGWR